MRQQRMWAATVGGALIALVAWSCWQRWQLLAASPFPLGVDGYFYPVQLRALLDGRGLAYPASPLAFYLLAPFAAATDPITGAKLGAALLGAAIALPAYAVGARLGGGRGPGLVAAALATTSTGSTYLAIEFVKNGIGLTVALTAIWLALRAAERPHRGRIAAAITGLVAAYATHKMAAALVLVVGVPAGLGALAARGMLRGRRLLYAIAALVAVAVAAVAIGALFPQRFLSAGDAQLARGLVSSTPRWAAPALVFPSGELALGHDALLGLVVAIAAIAMRIRGQRTRARPSRARGSPPPVREIDPRSSARGSPLPIDELAQPTSERGSPPPVREIDPRSSARGSAPPVHRDEPPAPPEIAAVVWPVLVLAIAIGLPFLAVTDREGLGFRLRIAAFVPAALAVAIALRPVLARWRYRDLVLGVVAAVLAVIRQPTAPLEGMVVTHPALVAAAQALSGHVPPGATLIVPERHIAFMVAWYAGAPIAIHPDRVPSAQRVRLLPLHFIVADSPLDRQLMAARDEPSLVPPFGVHPRHPDGLVLVTEPTWAWVLAQLPPADRARYAAWPTI